MTFWEKEKRGGMASSISEVKMGGLRVVEGEQDTYGRTDSCWEPQKQRGAGCLAHSHQTRVNRTSQDSLPGGGLPAESIREGQRFFPSFLFFNDQLTSNIPKGSTRVATHWSPSHLVTKKSDSISPGAGAGGPGAPEGVNVLLTCKVKWDQGRRGLRASL